MIPNLYIDMKKITFFTSFMFFTVLFSDIYAQLEAFTEEKLWALNRLSGGEVSPDEKHVLYNVTSYDVNENAGETKVVVYSLKEQNNQQVNKADKAMLSPRWTNENRIAFYRNKNNRSTIYHVDKQGEDEQKIGELGTAIHDFLISPKGNYLLALQSVKTKKTLRDKYPDLSFLNARVEEDLMYRHWGSWKDENNKQLFLYTLKENKVLDKVKNIMLGEKFDGILPPFGGMENISFSPDEEKIIYTSKKMKGKEFATSTNSSLYAYHVLNGETVNLTSSYEGYDTHPSFSPDGSQLTWLSMEKDGFEADKNDIILRNLAKNEDINLTKKEDLTVSSYKWSRDGKSIYFLAVVHATYQIFEIDLRKQKIEQLTEGIYNYGSIDEAGKELICSRQSMMVPNDLYSVNKRNGKGEQLTFVNDELLDKFSKPTIEKRWVTTSDNKKMLTWVILPPDFDASKKYPTLLYCQGGPQSAVSQFFSYRWNFRLMTSKGYIVIAPNRRGLPGFGQEWNDAISQDWGGQPMRDYLAAVDELKKEDYVDNDRVGAVGASYGGYSVFYLAGIHEGRFKSLIAHCGLFNMTSWYGTTEELFFANWELGGPYWEVENKEQYEQHSPHKLVQNWDTPILIIQGGSDYRVPENQSFEAFQAAQLKGIKSKLLYFPDENHWILQPQNALVWQKEFYEWLDETL